MDFSKEQNYEYHTAIDSFLQSVEWEAFQRSLGRKTWRVEGVLVIRHDLLLGLNWLYCPRPELRDKLQATPYHPSTSSGGTGQASDKFFYEMEKIAEQEKSIFFKIDPAENNLLSTICRLPSTRSFQPRQTLFLDLSQPEEQLLAAMHQKTRYNIRLAERKELGIRNYELGSKKDLEIFCGLMQETARRDRFAIHPLGYYEKLLAVRSDTFSNELFFAEYRGMVLAAAFVNLYRGRTSIGASAGTATYLYGASADEHREVMAPHLLHWEIIKEVKRRGFRYYDFWGIDEQKWPGVTRFKKGFGGTIVEYPESADVIYRSTLCSLYHLARRFLR